MGYISSHICPYLPSSHNTLSDIRTGDKGVGACTVTGVSLLELRSLTNASTKQKVSCIQVLYPLQALAKAKDGFLLLSLTCTVCIADPLPRIVNFAFSMVVLMMYGALNVLSAFR